MKRKTLAFLLATTLSIGSYGLKSFATRIDPEAHEELVQTIGEQNVSSHRILLNIARQLVYSSNFGMQRLDLLGVENSRESTLFFIIDNFDRFRPHLNNLIIPESEDELSCNGTYNGIFIIPPRILAERIIRPSCPHHSNFFEQ